MLSWSRGFNAQIGDSPTTYGLTAGQATTYEGLHAAFEALYNEAQDRGTRTPAVIADKKVALKNLKANARLLARIIQATPGVTDGMKTALGLTVRAEPAPVNPPTEMPVVEVVDRVGTIVTLKLHDGSGSRRGKPEGVQGASVFSYVGATPPTDASGWRFEGNTTRTSVDVAFPANLAPGTTVFVTAFWYNPRGESGPGCAPVSTNIAGGSVAQAA
jgi:hypothetical protein